MLYEKYLPVLEKRVRRGRLKPKQLQHFGDKLRTWDETYHRILTENLVHSLKGKKRVISNKRLRLDEYDKPF